MLFPLYFSLFPSPSSYLSVVLTYFHHKEEQKDPFFLNGKFNISFHVLRAMSTFEYSYSFVISPFDISSSRKDTLKVSENAIHILKGPDCLQLIT